MTQNGTTPATKEDLAKLKEELLGAIQQGDAKLKEELLEGMRDIETHLLKAIYGYTEGIQKHFNDLDASDTSMRERLVSLEDRLAVVERRLNYPHFNP